MTVVVDASVVVSALVDNSREGQWADDVMVSGPLAAPHLLPVETANALRKAARARAISDDVASLAHGEFGELPIELFDYQPFATRVWELRPNLRAYDAWYVAIAEALAAPLATLDSRLTRATGPRCEFLTPDS